MINIDFLTLKAFFIENIDFFIGARVQKIQQPTRKDFIFSLRNNSESRKLYININPEIYHISFMSKENENKRYITIPKKPPMFCMLLRKYLEGCRIEDAVVINNERIIEFHFEITDELSQIRSLCLCVELMGKHSNIILYDRKTNIIIGCAHNVGAEKNRYRELKGGLKYIYPPSKHDGFTLSNELKLQFEGLSSQEIQKYLQSENFRPAVKDERYTLFAELIEHSEPKQSVNQMLDDYYSDFQERKLISAGKNMLKSIINAKIDKINNSLKKLSNLNSEKKDYEKYRNYGELITANIYKNQNYVSEIEVYDYNLGKNIIISLDSTKTLAENAQKYFKLYTKSKKTFEQTLMMSENLNIQKKYHEDIIYSIDSASRITDLDEIKEELGLKPQEKTKNHNESVLKLNINGFSVYVGKNNKQNDYIVSKLAKDNDFWFHIKTSAGSHVLLKTENKEPDEQTIFECCKLAKKYSSAKMPSKVPVIYTNRKFLKKPPAAPLGYVTYKNEKEILI